MTKFFYVTWDNAEMVESYELRFDNAMDAASFEKKDGYFPHKNYNYKVMMTFKGNYVGEWEQDDFNDIKELFI